MSSSWGLQYSDVQTKVEAPSRAFGHTTWAPREQTGRRYSQQLGAGGRWRAPYTFWSIQIRNPTLESSVSNKNKEVGPIPW